MKKTYKDELAGAIHEMATGIYDAGLMPKSTMREIEELCLTPVEKLSPDEIKAIREEALVSQAVFARHLNVTTGIVSQWERGEKIAQRQLAQIADSGQNQRAGLYRLKRR